MVLAKVMEVAKEIRSDDKKRGAAPAGAGRLLAFLGAGEARRKIPAAVVGGAVGGGQCAGVMVCLGWLGREMVRRRSAAAIRRYLISH